MTARRVLALALLCCAAGAAVPAGAEAKRSQFTMFEASRELKSDNPALRQGTFDEIQAFGVHWLRVVLYWREVAPDADARDVPDFDETDPAAYPAGGWAAYDRLISEAKARDMRVLVTVSGPVPRWATRGGDDHVTRPSPTRFRRFMQAVGTRYGDDVRYWSIWNEPNHPDFLQPQYRRGRPYSPRLYRRLFQEGRRGLERSGNENDRVLFGETAPRGNRNVVFPMDFMRTAMCLDSRYRKRRGCGSLDVDGYAHHPYTTSSGPWFRGRADDVTIGTLSRLTRGLDRARRARAVRKRVDLYLTEFGTQSTPDRCSGVSEPRQSDYRSIAERTAWRNGRVRAFSQYLMRDDFPRDGSGCERWGGFESGLRHSDGQTKDAYDGFRLPLVARRSGSRTSLWGLVRPADGETRVEIEYRSEGSTRWRRLKRDRTDRRGYWETRTRYRRDRLYRVAWTGEDGTEHTSALAHVYRR
jgi:hypothetical protein